MATEKEHVCRTPGLNKCQVSLAIKALIEHHNKRPAKSEKKQPLFEVASRIQLMVTVWRIPPKDCVIKIGLPHSVRSDDVEVCLFTKDEPKMSPEQTCSFYTKLLQKSDIKSITRVIPYQTLKKEYKPYEAKLKLLRSYDLFLADSRIRRLLPSHLGRHFYAAKKAPLSVNLLHKNLDRELGRFISGTALHVSNKGNCNTVLVGNTTMELNNIVENVMTVASTMAKKCPGGWGNVKVLHLKTQLSVALPVYTASLDAIATVLNRKDLFKSTADEEKPSGEKKKKKREKLVSPGEGSPAKKAKLQAEGELSTTEASDDTAGVKASTKSSAKKKKRDEAKESSVCVDVSAVEEDEVAVVAAVETLTETLAKTPEETPSKKAERNSRKKKNCTPTPGGLAARVKEDDAEVKMDVEKEVALVSFLSEIRKNTPLKTPTKKKTQKEEQTPSSGQGDSGAKREKEENKFSAIVVEGCAFPAEPLCGLPEKVLVKTPKRKGIKTPQKSTADTKQEAEKEDIVTACDVPASPVINVLSKTPGKSTVKTPAKTPKQKRAKTPSKPASDDDVKKEEKIPESIDVDTIPIMAPLSETPAKTPAKTPKRKQPNTPSMPTVAKGSNGFEEGVSAASADHGEVPLVIELSDTEEITSTKAPNKTPKQKRSKTPSKPDAARDDDKEKVVDVDLCQAGIIIELSDTEETTSKTRAKTAKVSRAKTPVKRSVAALRAAISSLTEIKVGEESGSMAPHTGQAVESGNGGGREEDRNAGSSGPSQEEDDVVMELPARTPRRKAALAANEAIIVLNEKKRSGGRRTRASDASASETGSECGSDVGSGLEDCVAVGEWAARRGEGGRRRR